MMVNSVSLPLTSETTVWWPIFSVKPPQACNHNKPNLAQVQSPTSCSTTCYLWLSSSNTPALRGNCLSILLWIQTFLFFLSLLLEAVLPTEWKPTTEGFISLKSNFSTSTNAVQLLWNPSHRVKGRSKRTLRSKSLPPRHKLCAANHSNVAVQEDDHKKLWEESKQSISALDFTAEEADLMLKKAFGWVHSPYWGEERRRTLPEYDVGLFEEFKPTRYSRSSLRCWGVTLMES